MKYLFHTITHLQQYFHQLFSIWKPLYHNPKALFCFAIDITNGLRYVRCGKVYPRLIIWKKNVLIDEKIKSSRGFWDNHSKTERCCWLLFCIILNSTDPFVQTRLSLNNFTKSNINLAFRIPLISKILLTFRIAQIQTHFKMVYSYKYCNQECTSIYNVLHQ